MRCEPISGQDFLACADARGHICELDPHQDGIFGPRKDTVGALGNDEELVPMLREGLASPALPAHRLRPCLPRFTPQPIGRRPRAPEPGEHDVDPHRPRRT